ncbi:transporter [Ganoderma sinense ZZ0214-1]|uniref:Transporter n=1 Tax=Ganoderma sinense ZZ0214-1 TaxID=1077348 RepID=A0A2G8SK98_9APHY|nr:transporter [Ganoderma sinense ZZ0214-1]
MVSLFVKEKLYVNEVVLGTTCGIIFGPYGFDIFNPRSWGGDLNVITLEVMRITLAAGLFAIGVDLPESYLWDRAKSLLVMVVPTMAFGWIVVAAVIFALFPQLNFVSALVIAACLTPTDPIISAAIVGGRYANAHVPQALRNIISAESAANDGLAYPFLSISIYLTVETSKRVAFGKWFLVGWLYQVILGTVIGAVLGTSFSRLLKLAERHNFIDRESYVAQYLALALLTIGVTRTLGSDDLLAAFAAGSAINWDGHFRTATHDQIFFTVIDLLLNCGCFVYIGAWMPFSMFNAPELGITPWRLVLLVIAVLLLRRIPPLLLLYKWVPEIGSWRDALFTGHFVTELPTPHSPPQSQAELLAATLQTIVAFVVLCSIFVHGLSIPLLCYGRDIGRRTLTLTRTWTSRRGNGNAPPDWLIGVRRGPTIGVDRMGTKSVHNDGEDVELDVRQVESVAGSDGTGEEKSGEGSLENNASGPEVIVVEVPSRQPESRLHLDSEREHTGVLVSESPSPSPASVVVEPVVNSVPVAAAGKPQLREEEGKSIDAGRDGPNRAPRPPPRASLRRREQSPAKSIQPLRLQAREDIIVGIHEVVSSVKTPRPLHSSAEGSAEGSPPRLPPDSFAVARNIAPRTGSGCNVSEQVGRTLPAGVDALERLPQSDAGCHQTVVAGRMTGNRTSKVKTILGQRAIPRAIG